MWTTLSIILKLSICLPLFFLILHQSALAQINSTTGPTDNKTTTAGDLTNGNGIMHNTTGIIDDAFDALKDSFGTFFGGN
jgi:hypothetical protein